ncbi:MAG: DNA starvation/stationary phase protection protein [Paludibacter sp.]|nr:DNA starvation/stationary phase protection protein [Paludibacter sp.]
MKTSDFTGLSEVTKVVNALQQLLADYQVFYTNLRGFHWNIKGKDFFVLHSEYEKLYENVSEKADEIAERILMLGKTPVHNFSEYLKVSKIKETGVVSVGEEGLVQVLDSLKYFIGSERAALTVADEAGDEATAAMMSDYIREQEKLVWMLVAYKSE